MSCDDIDLLLAAQAVGSLEAGEGLKLDQHLRGCNHCRSGAAHYAAAAALLPLSLHPLDPPAALRVRLFKRISEEARRSEQTSGLRERAQAFWKSIARSRGLRTAAALSAAMAVTLLSLHLVPRPAQTPAPAAIHFRGTTQAPSAVGTLTYDPRSRQAVLTVDGLLGPPAVPRTGPGAEAYEVWLIRPDNSVMAAAYLSLAPDGHTWTAAINTDLNRYVGLATTVEPPGGRVTPTGPEVIRTALPDTAAG